MNPTFARLFFCAALWLACIPVQAAESYDNCTGFIDTLPATITTQGTWCLRKDVNTAMTSGNAITIATNNVTIDCNDFKLGGLSAGAGTETVGIYADERNNITVRHCNIRGFMVGVGFLGAFASNGGTSGGHVIEDNRFDGNTQAGIQLIGNGSIVQRNVVTDTGGSSSHPGIAVGINTNDDVDVLDNLVQGVAPTADGSGNGSGLGLQVSFNKGGTIGRNRVRSLVRVGNGTVYGIRAHQNGRVSLLGNQVIHNDSSGSVGLYCASDLGRAKDNLINEFATAIATCRDDGNSL